MELVETSQVKMHTYQRKQGEVSQLELCSCVEGKRERVIWCVRMILSFSFSKVGPLIDVLDSVLHVSSTGIFWSRILYPMIKIFTKRKRFEKAS